MIDMEIANEIHKSIWHDITTARTYLQFDDVVIVPHKFLRVHKTVGVMLPYAFRAAAFMALARIYDNHRNRNIGSLKNLVNLAYEESRLEWVNAIHDEILPHREKLEYLRNNVLAHADVSKERRSIMAGQLKELVNNAHKILNDVSRVIWKDQGWNTEIKGAEADIKAFKALLESWICPS